MHNAHQELLIWQAGPTQHTTMLCYTQLWCALPHSKYDSVQLPLRFGQWSSEQDVIHWEKEGNLRMYIMLYRSEKKYEDSGDDDTHWFDALTFIGMDCDVVEFLENDKKKTYDQVAPLQASITSKRKLWWESLHPWIITQQTFTVQHWCPPSRLRTNRWGSVLLFWCGGRTHVDADEIKYNARIWGLCYLNDETRSLFWSGVVESCSK